MSHVAKYVTKLGQVVPDIFKLALQAAMEELAAETGGTVVKQVSEGHYDKTEVICGVQNNEYRSGIGFRLNEANVPEICVEAYHQNRDRHDEIEGRVQQYYGVLCTELQLRKLGYNVSKRKVDGVWEIFGVDEEEFA